MLISNHPEEERLSALASRDDDATTDAALASHVADCVRCTELVTELGALRASLADMPELAPPRPLRLLPPVADAPAAVGGGVGWVRRMFAPVMAAGAALAMVGLIGTASPVLQGFGAASGAAPDADAGAAEHPASSLAQVQSSSAGEAGAEDGPAAPAAEPSEDGSLRGEVAGRSPGEDGAAGYETLGDPPASRDDFVQLPAERSPWPMVLFTGLALIVGALLLRWVLVPRVG